MPVILAFGFIFLVHMGATMGDIVQVVLFVAVLGLAFMLVTGRLHARISTLTVIFFIPTFITGFILYFIGYIPAEGDIAEYANAMMMALLSTVRMFILENDYGTIIELGNGEIATGIGFRILFWLCQTIAVLIFASTVMSVFGRKLSTSIRLWIGTRKDTYIIFGVNSKSLIFANDIAAKSNRIVFIDETVDSVNAAQIDEIDCMYLEMPVFSDATINRKALAKAGLKKKGIFSGPMTLLIFTDDEIANYKIAAGILEYLRDTGFPADRLKGVYVKSNSDVITERIEDVARKLKCSIHFFSEPDLTSREFIQKCPIYKMIEFDRNKGVASNRKKITILLLGFGSIGRQMLRKIYGSSQFIGCTFHAVVVDKRISELEGEFRGNYPSLFDRELSNAEIRFLDADISSTSFYSVLDEYIRKSMDSEDDSIDLVISALGDDLVNIQTVSNIKKYFDRYELKSKPLYALNITGDNNDLYRNEEVDGDDIVIFGYHKNIFTGDIILNEKMDLMAKAVDRNYGGTDWDGLSVHLKNSNRAAAEYIEAFLHIAGFELKKTTGAIPSDAISENDYHALLESNDELFDNLAMTEQLRWNAFHISTGWITKPIEEVRRYEDRKDEKKKAHVCLIPHHRLEWLENAMKEIVAATMTGDERDRIIRKCNFREQDRSNVRNIFNIIDEYNKGNTAGEKLYVVRK
jgi:hypothetical protein